MVERRCEKCGESMQANYSVRVNGGSRTQWKCLGYPRHNWELLYNPNGRLITITWVSA